MNSNRTRYTQTPTFGMQKRGLFGSGKKNLFQKAEPTAPDFTKAPPQAEIPNPAFFSVPTQNVMPQDASMMPPPYAMPQTPMQGYQSASVLPTGGIPMPSGYADPMTGGFAMPNSNLGGVTPQGNMGSMNGISSVPGMTPMNNIPGSYASPNMPPLGANSQQLNAGFSNRGQGFIPPQQPAPAAPAAPDVQPAGFNGFDTMNYGAPAMPNGGQPFFGQQPQPQNNFFPQGAPQQPNGNMQSSFMQMAAQNQANQPRGMGGSTNPNLLWMVFLFGLIPLLFIPCLFVSQSLNVLRYLFLVICITGLGIMWYRQMLGPVARIVISALYAGMCIFVVSTLMQPTKDVQLAPPVSQNTPSAQIEFTPEPASSDYDLAAAAGLAAPVESPTPTPAAKSDAEVRLEFFMNYWCGNNVQDMVTLVQPSWATAQESAVTSLFNLLTNRLPLNYQIEEVMGTDDDTSRSVTMVAEIDKQNGKDPVIYRFTVLMVKEGGQWYVNPNSLATNDAVPQEEVVVNDKTQGLTTTEAPRTTVSPPPPADTVLYYNPDGGHYFHMDANCESIKEEFRPLTGTFLYQDLRQYNKNLSPCLRCGAPTTALPVPTDAPIL